MESFHEYFYAPRAKAFWEPIGRYVFSFGLLERDIDGAVSALLNIPYYFAGQTTMRQINNVTSKVKLLPVLARFATTDKSKITRMKDLASELGMQNTFRNHLVHGPWTAYLDPCDGPGEPAWSKPQISARLNPTSWSVKVSEINQNADRLEHLSELLRRLTAEISEDREGGHAPSLEMLLAQPPED